MATKIIGPNGGADYATPALWFASLSSSLAANETGECQNAEITVTAAQSLSGITTNGFTITLTAGAGNSFADNASKTTNALRYNASNGAAIRKTSGSDALFDIQNSNVTISKLQLAKDTVYGYVIYMPDSGYTGRVIDQCILQFNNTPANQTLLGSNITVKNTLVLARSNVPGVFNAGGASNYQNVVIANVSGGGGTTGFDAYSGSPTLRNVAVYGFATDYSGTAGTCANNATDKGAFGGTNFGTSGQVSLVGSTEWESVTASSEDFRLKSTSAKLKDNGTATSVPSTDIIGQSRSGSTDIGVWELQAGGGSVGAASGSGTATATGASAAKSPGSAAGTGTATGVGKSAAVAAGSAAGIGAAAGVGKSAAVAPGIAAGIGAAAGVGASRAEGVGAASGTATAEAVGTSLTGGQGIGSASGVGAAAAVGASRAEAVGSAAGSSNVVGIGSSVGGESGGGASKTRKRLRLNREQELTYWRQVFARIAVDDAKARANESTKPSELQAVIPRAVEALSREDVAELLAIYRLDAPTDPIIPVRNIQQINQDAIIAILLAA